MDLGSIEDLLRPASLVERKQRLGLLKDASSSSSGNLAPSATMINATTTVSTADSRSVEKEKPATTQNHHRLSPNLKRSKPPSSINKDKSLPSKAQQKKRIRMENRPPLAPKPDSLKESSPPTTAGAPVPRPRKKPGAPSPAKPMPYRKHVELKDKEVSTFKSSTPVAPPRVRQRPAVPAAKPPPPSYRLPIPGEPSDFYQPKAESKAPVQFAIPVVPKRPNKPPSATSAINTRPRLNTPQVVPDPDDVVGSGKRGGAVPPIGSHGTPSNNYPTTQSSSVNGVAGAGSNDELLSQNDAQNQPEWYAEAYAESEENDAEYAIVSPSRKAVVSVPPTSSAAVAVMGQSPPPRPPPPRGGRHPSPTPPITASQLHCHRSPSPSPISRTPPTPSSFSRQVPPTQDSVDDHEYNITSHVKDRVKKRSVGAPPIPPPTISSSIRAPPIPPPTVRPRSTRSPPPTQPSSVVPPPESDAYSVLDRPDKKPRAVSPAPVVQPLSEFEEYSVFNSEPDVKKPLQVSESDEYSALNNEPMGLPSSTYPAEAEGYGHLDFTASATNLENPPGDSSVYEEIRSESPVRDKDKSVGPTPSPPIQPQMDKHPRALARKASDKFKDKNGDATVLSSRDRSQLPAYQQPNEESVDNEKDRGVSRLPPRNRAPPPIPHPKRQKKMPPQQNNVVTPTGISSSESESANVSSDSKTHVLLNVLERAGYETKNTFSPPPEDMDVEKKEQKSNAKPPTPTRKISPVPAKTRGPKPPPLPKPKQLSPPMPHRAEKVATSQEQELTKEEGSTSASTVEGQSMDYESGHNTTVETVDGSHDSHMVPVHKVSSPKIELDIDHITRVGSALVDYQAGSLLAEEALYDNQMVVDAVSQGETLAEQQKRASRSSYENQIIVDVVQGESHNGAADSTTKLQQSDGTLAATASGRSEGSLEQTLQFTQMEVSGEHGDGLVEMTDRDYNEEEACTQLTPSDVFTVPQHAVPGHLGYCDIDLSHTKDVAASEHAVALVQNRPEEGGGTGSGTFTVQPHAYPDPHGYCDIEIKQSPSHSAVAQPNSVTAGVAATTGDVEEIVTDPRGYCDIDIRPPPSGGGVKSVPLPQTNDSTKDLSTVNDVVMDAQGYCDIDIKTPPPSTSVSHEYEVVPETAKKQSSGAKGRPKLAPHIGKAPPIPSSRPKPGSKVQDKTTQEESGNLKASGDASKKDSSNKGVPPKRPPPRRRAPPPPPLKSKTIEEPSEKSPQSSPLQNELVISTGLATMPRSPKKQPPKPPPPFASSNSPLLSKRMSPLLGKKLDLKAPPLPSSSPLSSPVPPGSPKGWDSTNEPPQSSGLKKKFKGLFKQKQASAPSGTGDATNAANNGSSGGLTRRPSWGRRKKGKTSNVDAQDNGAQLSPGSKAKSLPGYALHCSQPGQAGSLPKLQLQCSYDADQEDDDEFSLYSTINQDKLKPSSAEAAAVASPADVKDNEQDESGYDVVDKKPRSISISTKKKKKSGKKGFEMRKASSVEHLYETADFNDDVNRPKSARNSPQVPRKPPERGDHAPGPAANPALPLPNRNFLAGPPNLDELKVGVDPSQLYAQVVASPKQSPKQKSNELSVLEKNSADSAGVAQEATTTGDEGTVAGATGGVQEVEGDHVPEPQKEEGEGKDQLVVTSLDERFGHYPSPERDVNAEIEHTMEGEDTYAVVPAKLKKKARRQKFKSSEKEQDQVDGTPPTVNESGPENSTKVRNPGKKAPPKPPKSYQEYISSSPSGRVSPMAMFASATQEKADGQNRSPSVVATTSSPSNLSPPPPPPVDIALGLTPQERTRVASFSSGPPSFPPPPPPKSVSPEPIGEDEGEENPYNTVDEMKKPKRKAPPAPGGRKPPPPRAQNGSLGEDEPGYEAVKNDRRTGRKKDSQKNKPGLVHIDKASKPHLSPNQRAPHVYTTFEVVEDESGEVKGKEGSITVPVKTPAAGYATVSHSKRVTLPSSLTKRDPGRLLKNPKLSPKSRPPPPPPGQRRPGDSSTLPSPGHPLSKQLASPMAGDSPSSEDQIGKRIFVSMENSPTPDSAGLEPKFLFSHAQKFIVVGDAENTPTVTNLYEEEDSDGEVLDSTDWETSSGGEEAEEEREQTPEPKEARPKTFYIAREILTTERTFVKGLTLIDKDFRQAMRSANNAHEKPVITEEGLKTILGNVGSLLSLNSGLLQELEERMAQWSTNPCIGDILLSRAPYLKLYTEYISKFDKALKTLEEFTKKNPVFAQVLREFESQPKCANLPLAGYMLDIVQRITRYKLLLADYVKHLPDDSPDKDESQKALVIISSVATHVNETVRQMDNFRKVCDVRKRLIGDSGDTLITPHRKLLKEGELMKFSRKEKQPRMFFLFNDILIYASSIPPANTTYKVIKRIPLDGMRVEHLDDPEMRYGFQIISTCKSFRLEASNREELHQWFTAFEVAIKEHCDRKKIAEPKVEEETDSSAPLGSLAPPWLPDSAVSMCQLCSTHFTVTRRRHHCRACGKIFCSDCSSYLAPLKYKNNKLGRVCQICYEKLPKNEDAAITSKRMSIQRATKSRVSLPSVLKEVKARDQSAQVSGYLLARNAKTRKWKKRWFVVFNLVLYEFERHEDVSAKRSITLPSYQVARHDSDPLVFVLKHPGTGKEYFKEDSPEQVDRWIEVLQKAVLGEIEEEEPATDNRSKEGAELREEEEDEEEEEEETGEESSPSHHTQMDTPSDTTSDAGQSPSKESSLSQEQPHPVIMDGDEETNS